MELDDFKQDWKKSGEQFQTPKYNINKLLASQSSLPLSILKKKYIKQVILLPLAAGFLGLVTVMNPVMQQSAFIWFIIPVLLLLAVLYYRDYRLILNMEQTNANTLKTSLEENVSLLHRTARQQLLFIKMILVLFILVLEGSMYFQQTTDFNFWQGIFLPVRLAVYALILYVQPYVTKYFFNLNFGQYTKRLQALLDQAG